MESEFNEILDHITKLSGKNPSAFEQTSTLLNKINNRKGNVKDSMNLLKVALEKELTIRDLSEEKMKNASLLGIQLPIQ